MLMCDCCLFSQSKAKAREDHFSYLNCCQGVKCKDIVSMNKMMNIIETSATLTSACRSGEVKFGGIPKMFILFYFF